MNEDEDSCDRIGDASVTGVCEKRGQEHTKRSSNGLHGGAGIIATRSASSAVQHSLESVWTEPPDDVMFGRVYVSRQCAFTYSTSNVSGRVRYTLKRHTARGRSRLLQRVTRPDRPWQLRS